jgi:hypothetical protein
MILGAKFLKWANFPWFSQKTIRQFSFFSKNDLPNFHRIKLFYLKNHQNFIETILNPYKFNDF